MNTKVRIKSLSGILPEYQTGGSAGMDLRAYFPDEPGEPKEITLAPGERALVGTGIFIELPEGFEGQVRARSGLAAKQGIGLVNGVGTIDSDYRGEIKAALINWGQEPVTITGGDRIAQLVIAKYEKISWEPADSLDETERNAGGFGHTGKR